MLLFGFGMVLIMVWRPRGLIATRDPSTLLNAPRSSRLQEEKAQTTQPSLVRERPR
jgi:branched-chain amino acid transport system permease protein